MKRIAFRVALLPLYVWDKCKFMWVIQVSPVACRLICDATISLLQLCNHWVTELKFYSLEISCMGINMGISIDKLDIGYTEHVHCTRGIATKFWARVPAAAREPYDGASARSGRAGTIGLMLKSWETWGCWRGYLADLGMPGSPRHSRWRRPCIALQRVHCARMHTYEYKSILKYIGKDMRITLLISCISGMQTWVILKKKWFESTQSQKVLIWLNLWLTTALQELIRITS